MEERVECELSRKILQKHLGYLQELKRRYEDILYLEGELRIQSIAWNHKMWWMFARIRRAIVGSGEYLRHGFTAEFLEIVEASIRGFRMETDLRRRKLRELPGQVIPGIIRGVEFLLGHIEGAVALLIKSNCRVKEVREWVERARLEDGSDVDVRVAGRLIQLVKGDLERLGDAKEIEDTELMGTGLLFKKYLENGCLFRSQLQHVRYSVFYIPCSIVAVERKHRKFLRGRSIEKMAGHVKSVKGLEESLWSLGSQLETDFQGEGLEFEGRAEVGTMGAEVERLKRDMASGFREVEAVLEACEYIKEAVEGVEYKGCKRNLRYTYIVEGYLMQKEGDMKGLLDVFYHMLGTNGKCGVNEEDVREENNRKIVEEWMRSAYIPSERLGRECMERYSAVKEVFLSLINAEADFNKENADSFFPNCWV